jgi:hypothetical protein
LRLVTIGLSYVQILSNLAGGGPVRDPFVWLVMALPTTLVMVAFVAEVGGRDVDVPGRLGAVPEVDDRDKLSWAERSLASLRGSSLGLGDPLLRSPLTSDGVHRHRGPRSHGSHRRLDLVLQHQSKQATMSNGTQLTRGR